MNVLNGNGGDAVATTTAASLTQAGFRVASTGNALSYDYRQTIVQYAPGKQEKGALLRSTLVAGAALEEDKTLTGSDVTLVVGLDYNGLKSSATTVPATRRRRRRPGARRRPPRRRRPPAENEDLRRIAYAPHMATEAVGPDSAGDILGVLNEDSFEVQVAAVDAMTWLPVDRQLWKAAEPAVHAMLDRALAPGGAGPQRSEAIAAGAGVPLPSVRRRLLGLAQDRSFPDWGTALFALAGVGEVRVVPALVELAQQPAQADGQMAIAALATLPIEGHWVEPASFAAGLRSPSADVRLWSALAVARLGNTGPLEEELAISASSDDLTQLFWGSPWTAYERLAAMRPVPDELVTWLRAREDSIGLLAWAVTGDRDAEGTPIVARAWERRQSRDRPREVERPPERRDAIGGGGCGGARAVGSHHTEGRATRSSAPSGAMTSWKPSWRCTPGSLPIDRLIASWDTLSGVIDTGQLAHLGAYAGLPAALRAVRPALQRGPAAAKVEALRFLKGVGQELAAPSSPFRGAGGGGGGMVHRVELFEEAMAEAPPRTTRRRRSSHRRGRRVRARRRVPEGRAPAGARPTPRQGAGAPAGAGPPTRRGPAGFAGGDPAGVATPRRTRRGGPRGGLRRGGRAAGRPR